MDLLSSVQEAPNDFNANVLDDTHDHPYGKSSHAFRTISEVSDELDVPQHVLRFWESKFSQIRPLKRGGGRRYYRPEDIELLKRIKNFLYKQGYTIKGVQRLLKEKRQEAVASFIPYANPTVGIQEAQNLMMPDMAPISVSSYLQAAAAAPSALAMAYGSIGGQIAERAGQHHFGDAFEQSTVKIPAEVNTATDQMEKSLFAVTQLHEEIASQVQPIRISNPAAPSLEDMADDIINDAVQVIAAKEAAKELELSFEIPAATANAAQAVPQEVLQEAFEEDAFNQDVVDEEIPVKRLDAEVFEEVVEVAAPVVAPVAPQPERIPERIIERVIEVQTVYVQAPPAPAIAPEKKEELKGLLAEMMMLRDMLSVGISV